MLKRVRKGSKERNKNKMEGTLERKQQDKERKLQKFLCCLGFKNIGAKYLHLLDKIIDLC